MVVNLGISHHFVHTLEVHLHCASVLCADDRRICEYRFAAFHVNKSYGTIELKIDFALFHEVKHGDIMLTEPQVFKTIPHRSGFDK